MNIQMRNVDYLYTKVVLDIAISGMNLFHNQF